MPQLPHTSNHQHDDLRQTVPHRPGVRRLAEVAEVGLALALVLLLAADVLELLVEIPELRGELGDVRPVVFAVGLRAADDDVEVQPNVRGGAPRRPRRARQADRVVPRFVRGEGEAAVVGPPCAHDVVGREEFLWVVWWASIACVESERGTYVYFNKNAQPGVLDIFLLLLRPLEGLVVSCATKTAKGQYESV